MSDSKYRYFVSSVNTYGNLINLTIDLPYRVIDDITIDQLRSDCAQVTGEYYNIFYCISFLGTVDVNGKLLS